MLRPPAPPPARLGAGGARDACGARQRAALAAHQAGNPGDAAAGWWPASGAVPRHVRRLPACLPACCLGLGMGKSSCVGHTRSVQACAQPSTAASCVKCCRGMTDSRHYNDLAEGRVYRFCPHRYTRSSIQLVHGVDERIAGATQDRMGLFWLRLLIGLQRRLQGRPGQPWRLSAVPDCLLHSFTVSKCPATHTPHLPWACLLACLPACSGGFPARHGLLQPTL